MLAKPLLPPSIIELTDDDLECVIGEQTTEQFDEWRIYLFNEIGILVDYENSIYDKLKN